MSAPLTRMRAAMRPFHDRIESSLDLMSSDIDRPRYTRFIERSYGFIGACERALDHSRVPDGLDLPRRMKSQLLADDLVSLGHSPGSLAQLPQPDRLPQVASWPSALGYLYVIEGSTLGGQVLSRHLKATLSLPEQSLRFLTSYGPETGTMWKQMIAVLESGIGADAAEPEITAAAQSTFELLEAWHRAD